MNQISPISDHDFKTVCRLCLTRGVAEIDIFRFSNKLQYEVADLIMKCAPVQIIKGDGMPNLICPICYTQLEKNHQFQVQVVQSERILRQCHAFDKELKPECSLQTSCDDPFNSADATTKCDPFGFHSVFDVDVNKKDKTSTDCNKTSLKSIIKEEPRFDDCFLTGCLQDTESTNNDGSGANCKDSKSMVINWEEHGYSNAKRNNIEEVILKSEIDDTTNSPFRTDSIDGTENAISQDDLEINYRNNKPQNVSSFYSVDQPEDMHKKTNHKCEQCNKCFSYLNRFINHKCIHTGEKPYSCDFCDKCFDRARDLNTHRRTHTGEKPFKCVVCDANFNDSSTLRRHKRIHTGEKPYRCDVCNKCFFHSGDLKAHKRTHTGEKPYRCEVCNRRFNYSNSLSIHKRTHTGEKPYQCDVCSAKFSDQSSLRTHKRMHTGEKPYQCDVCSKSFPKLSYLNIHKRIHTGEKPFKCEVCNKCFAQLASLHNHKRVHTGKKLASL